MCLKHSKIKNIKYEKLETQKYMTSSLFRNNEVNLLFALRSRNINCKANFRNKNIDILCQLCFKSEDDQPHIMKCKVINQHFKSKEIFSESVEYSDLFKEDIRKQKVIVNLYENLLEIRKQLLEENTNSPSISGGMLKKSYNLHPCIVNFSFGN